MSMKKEIEPKPGMVTSCIFLSIGLKEDVRFPNLENLQVTGM